MAFGDEIKKSKEELKALTEELVSLDSQLKSIGENIKSSITDQTKNSSEEVKKLANSFSQDLSGALKRSNTSLNKNSDLINKINKGKNVGKEVEKEIEKIQKERAVALRKFEALQREGVKLSEAQKVELEEAFDSQLDSLGALSKQNTEAQKTKSLFSLLQENAAGLADKIDKTGTLSALLNGNLEETVTFSRLAQAGFLMLLNGALQASDNIANIAKNTGVSADEAQRLQLSFGITAAESGKLFVTSKDLNKSFIELTKSTGLIADFGGDILVTQTTLTKQLGLSAENAGKLSTLARIQSKDTEGVLENAVATASALGAQNKVGIDVKGVLEEISQVSDAIAVSLGKNPVEIAKAVTQSKLLGLSLSEVDAIASSILDFESSINAELEAELLIGKDLNLERARLLALNNDLAGLAEEIRGQEEN